MKDKIESAISKLVETKERRFRASIYVDIFIPETDLEKDREEARKQVEEYSSQIPNSYVGGVAEYNPHRRDPLDREL